MAAQFRADPIETNRRKSPAEDLTNFARMAFAGQTVALRDYSGEQGRPCGIRAAARMGVAPDPAPVFHGSSGDHAGSDAAVCVGTRRRFRPEISTLNKAG